MAQQRTIKPPPKGYYVYTLAWPNGEIFYVGKGKGRRFDAHLREAERRECICSKCRTIHRIWEKRQEVQIAYVFETGDPKAALAKEAELIKALAGQGTLANKEHVPYIAPVMRGIPRTRREIKALSELLDRRGMSRAERVQIEQEIADLKQSIGAGWQRSFDLLEDSADFDWTDL